MHRNRPSIQNYARSARSRSSDLATDSSERLVFEYSARSNSSSMMAKLSVSALGVHLFEAVVALIVTPIDEDGSVINARAMLAPTFKSHMGLGQGSYRRSLP